MNEQPVLFTWDGEAMIPAADKWARLSDKVYVIGENYSLVPERGRSTLSHRHFFASVDEAWLNLPESLSERFPSAEHLRKYCLVKAGFCTTESIVCGSPDNARQVAAFIRPVDAFSVLTVSGNVLTRYTAKSQSTKHMDKAEFQASKDAVFRVLEELIGSPVTSNMAKAA